MAERRLIVPLLLIAFLVAPLYCRRATGGAEDPFDREARDNFISYLRIDTSNPPGRESTGAHFLQQLLQKEGIEAKLVGSNPQRQSVYARLRSGSSDKALLLLHHIDVVPAVSSEWTKPPFGGTVAEGYIWGRGALDIKSLGIAEAMTLIDIKRRNLPLRRDIVFLAVADEEAGGINGCKELLEKHEEIFENVGFVMNEGGYNETIVDRVSFWGIEVQEKIPLWLAVHTKGVPGHAATPPDGGGTVAKLVKVLSSIAAIPTPYRLTPDVERFLHAAGSIRKDERGEVLRNIAAEIGGARIDRILSPAYRALLRDTVTITKIDAGTSTNSIPATAVAYVDARLLPDEQPEPMLQRIRDAAGRDADIEVLVSGTPAAATSTSTELYSTLERIMKKASPGSIVAPVVGAGATDSRWFRARGVVAYGVAPFKVNYYDAGTPHGIDERIRSNFFTEGVRLMRDIVTDFCERKG